ncbi:MAG: DNA polymerase IV, partial [Spirochaetaceae bacterium]|nr:DNA polymerase IV [Spirochaetaceae bacterium]
PPDCLAKKLKNAVHDKTGLTVSLGIASNKYIAKIASGMSKPDGATIIPVGTEEQFMLNLGVDKIWGAGKKSQEQFKKYGLKSCKDIHALSLETLSLMFGQAFSLFLYRAVRGEAAASFDKERGSHSISAERTFDYDIFDEFTIETALLDICHTLMFRLLDHHLQSKTVCIKIRYADFFTESAQFSSRHAVASVNDLFDRVSALFHKKYKNGTGIRLIGAGLMNLEDEKKSVQTELFDSGDDKQRQLEKCIHEINKKFPHAAIKKARLF